MKRAPSFDWSTTGSACEHSVRAPGYCRMCAANNAAALRGFHKQPRQPRPQQGDGIGIPDEMLPMLSEETRARLMMFRAGLITEADRPEVSA